MKIIGICGSPKKEKSTTLFALNKAMEAAEQKGLETQVVELSKFEFTGCDDCGACRKKMDCAIDDDFRNEILPILKNPDVGGFIFSSPVYFGSVTWLMKTFMDRCVVFRRNSFYFENRVAGMLTVGKGRHGGQELAAIDMVKNCMIQGMIIVPDSPPTSHMGGMLWSGISDGIENDQLGIDTAMNVGKKVAEIVKKMNP